MVYDNFEVTPKDILNLSSPDAFALFFAKLGYNAKLTNYDSNATKIQLHHDTDLLEKIRVCRQLVEHTDETFSCFYVYLYVLSNVNKTITRSIFRDLCKRQGDFLVVLTNDTYETIDLMYIDRSTSLPPVGHVVQPSLLDLLVDASAPKVGKAEARIITIDRRHPGKVALRVLNRFHWQPRHSVNAGDENLQMRSIAAHCEMLQSAYLIAEWSQEYFNNRALFSDHYLINTLPNQQEGEWKATTGSGREATLFTKSYASLRKLYDDAHDTFSRLPYEELREQLISPVLETLDFIAQPSVSLKDKTHKRLPSYTLFVKDFMGQPTSKVAICLAYTWGRNLDGYEEVADDGTSAIDETVHENPGAVIVTLLDQEKVDWAILTNGKIWRLYSAKTHSSATNYYEIDLEETLAIPRDRAKEAGDALRYFWLFFRANAFVAREQLGYKEPLSFLDYVLRESEAYAIALGNSLKKKIFEEIFTHFAVEPLMKEVFVKEVLDS